MPAVAPLKTPNLRMFSVIAQSLSRQFIFENQSVTPGTIRVDISSDQCGRKKGLRIVGVADGSVRVEADLPLSLFDLSSATPSLTSISESVNHHFPGFSVENGAGSSSPWNSTVLVSAEWTSYKIEQSDALSRLMLAMGIPKKYASQDVYAILTDPETGQAYPVSVHIGEHDITLVAPGYAGAKNPGDPLGVVSLSAASGTLTLNTFASPDTSNPDRTVDLSCVKNSHV